MAIFLISSTLIASCAVFSVVSNKTWIPIFIHHKSQTHTQLCKILHMQINFEEVLVMPSFNVSSLNSSDIESTNMTDAMNITDIDIQYSQPVETAPVYLFCCALSLAAISAFLRAGFVLKFICMMCCIAIQGCVLSLSKLFEFYDHDIDRTRFVYHLR